MIKKYEKGKLPIFNKKAVLLEFNFMEKTVHNLLKSKGMPFFHEEKRDLSNHEYKLS
jgi:hypothetical protein